MVHVGFGGRGFWFLDHLEVLRLSGTRGFYIAEGTTPCREMSKSKVQGGGI
jgi:hypothetical protein